MEHAPKENTRTLKVCRWMKTVRFVELASTLTHFNIPHVNRVKLENIMESMIQMQHMQVFMNLVKPALLA
jgi:hypothetical protein